MTTSAELLQTFETIAASQRKLREQIITMNGNRPLGDLQITLDGIDRTIAQCEHAIEALRNGEAFSVDDVMGGGIEGPFIDNEGREI